MASPSSVGPKPYGHMVKGLEKIFVQTGAKPSDCCASFVFKTAKAAEKAHIGIKTDFEKALFYAQERKCPESEKANLLEILRGSNISGAPDAQVLSYFPKSSFSNVGAPISDINDLINRVVKSMSPFSTSKKMKEAEIIEVAIKV